MESALSAIFIRPEGYYYYYYYYVLLLLTLLSIVNLDPFCCYPQFNNLRLSRTISDSHYLQIFFTKSGLLIAVRSIR
jgi:hypothetical protein